MGNAYGVLAIGLTEFHFTPNWADNKEGAFFEIKDLYARELR